MAQRAVNGHLRPVDRTPLYEGVLQRIREYAREVGLRKGDRLPSERDLAEQLAASRSTVKQALVVLEVQGLVETRHGGGSFLIKDELATESVVTLLDRKARLPHVLEARMALECKLAELAATRRTAAELAEITAALKQMAREVAGDSDAADGDRRFHQGVAVAGHNPLLSRFLAEIGEEIAESRAESLRQRDRPSQSLRQHTAIAEAIKAGDGSAARAAMRRHLASVSKVRLLAWHPDGPSRA